MVRELKKGQLSFLTMDGKTWRISLPLPEPTETNFYKVWQFSPDELEAHIVAGVSGLRPVKKVD